MGIFKQQQDYSELEQLPLQVRRTASVQLPWFWQAFLGFWHSTSGEPRVQKRTDGSGKVYWRVYDPIRDHTVRFDDEQKMLIWLDERHYRRARPNPWDMD